MTNEEAYVGCVEKLAGIEVPERAQYIRVIMEELSRLQSHLLGMGEYASFVFCKYVYVHHQGQRRCNVSY